MSRFDAFTRIADPVDTVARVVSATLPPDGQGSAACQMHLLVDVEGAGAVPVEVTKMIKMKRWPSPGQVLPVTISRDDPSRLKIRWSEVPTGRERAAEQAQRAADAANQARATSDGAAVTDGVWNSVTVNGQPVSGAQSAQIAGMIESLMSGRSPSEASGDGASAAADDPADRRIQMLERLAALKAAGILSDEELAAEKRRLFGG